MIRPFTLLILIFFQATLFSQQEEKPALLKTDSTWGKEFFQIPLDFAPEINYQGREEAAFPKNWAKKDSNEFWSYAFAWSINLATKLSEKELELHVQNYFDGLMKVVNQDPEIKIPNTQALFLLKEKQKMHSVFVGKVVIYDAFTTKKPLTLNVKVEQYLCKEQQNSKILFRFSPKDFEHAVWGKLEDIRLLNSTCESERK